MNMGECSIGRQTVTHGGPVVVNMGRTYIKEQVCLSGKVENKSVVFIDTRYIPPGSTCEIVDGPRVKVKNTLYEEPPP